MPLPESVERLRKKAFLFAESGNIGVSAELEKAAAMLEAASLLSAAIESLGDAIRYHGDMDI